jgi:hypothetical protein
VSTQPNLCTILSSWNQGEGPNGLNVSWIVSKAANIRFGTNPSYTSSDFFAIYPQFGSTGGDYPVSSPTAYLAYLTIIISLAQASISQNRWKDAWTLGMGLFIAHFMTLYLQSYNEAGTAANIVAASGLAKGIVVAQSAGDVSESKQAIGALEEWGGFNLTIYGQQLADFGRLIGLGGMYIW